MNFETIVIFLQFAEFFYSAKLEKSCNCFKVHENILFKVSYIYFIPAVRIIDFPSLIEKPPRHVALANLNLFVGIVLSILFIIFNGYKEFTPSKVLNALREHRQRWRERSTG